MQKKKRLFAKDLFGGTEFSSLKELQIFVQMERNTLFPILKTWNQSAFTKQDRIFAKWFNKKKASHDEETERILECNEEFKKK